MGNNKLLNNYYNACNVLLKAFCRKHSFDYKDAKQSWVAGHVGDTACCGDYFFNMDVIVTDLKEDAPEEELLRWHDYTLECQSLGTNGCNFHSWLKGCPRLSDAQLDELRRLHERVEEAKEQLKGCIEKCKEGGF